MKKKNGGDNIDEDDDDNFKMMIMTMTMIKIIISKFLAHDNDFPAF